MNFFRNLIQILTTGASTPDSPHPDRSRFAEVNPLPAAPQAPTAAKDHPLYYYNAQFDGVEVMRRHAVAGLSPTPGYQTNFLGVKIDPKFYPPLLEGTANTLEPIPIPGNWHADIAEWAAALRAVELAKGKFTMIELGCGWGCWINNMGVAARNAGKKVHLIGVEGDAGHIEFARESTATNGFSPDEVTIVRGIAAPGGGVALFPRQANAGGSWGLEPIFGASEADRARARKKGSHDELPMIPLTEVIGVQKRIDLLHIDIQGGEADFISGCLDVLRKSVAYIVVGVHSRQLEGRIFDTLLNAGWQLEIERPAILTLTPKGPVVYIDGLQGWRNPELT